MKKHTPRDKLRSNTRDKRTNDSNGNNKESKMKRYNPKDRLYYTNPMGGNLETPVYNEIMIFNTSNEYNNPMNNDNTNSTYNNPMGDKKTTPYNDIMGYKGKLYFSKKPKTDSPKKRYYPDKKKNPRRGR